MRIRGFASILAVLACFCLGGRPQAESTATPRNTISSGLTLAKARYQITISSTNGTLLPQSNVFIECTLEESMLQNDQISFILIGPDNSASLGDVTAATPDGLTLLDPKGAGKNLSSAKGDTVNGFTKAVVRYDVSKKRLKVRFSGGALNALPRAQTLSATLKKAKETAVSISVRLLVLRNNCILDLQASPPNNWTVKSKLNTKRNEIRSSGKTNK